MKKSEKNIYLGITLIFLIIIPFLIYFILQLPFWLGSFITKGEGQYTGTVVETQHHGWIFKTDGVQLKTGGFTPRFEDFCIIDSDIYTQLANIDRNKTVTVTYTKHLTTPSWQCDSSDSNDVVTAIKVEN